MATIFGDWKWGVRVTPPLGFILIVALLLFLDEPERGIAERNQNNGNSFTPAKKTSKVSPDTIFSLTSNKKETSNTRNSYLDDLKYLLTKYFFDIYTCNITILITF